ncbi:MAG: hypothetical protein ABH843_04225 [Candidatus Omnitrophota bacterium]
MKKIIWRMTIGLAITVLAGMVFTTSPVFAEGTKHKPITRELISLVEKAPEIRKMLEKSLTEAKKINPDPKTNPV